MEGSWLCRQPGPPATSACGPPPVFWEESQQRLVITRLAAYRPQPAGVWTWAGGLWCQVCDLHVASALHGTTASRCHLKSPPCVLAFGQRPHVISAEGGVCFDFVGHGANVLAGQSPASGAPTFCPSSRRSSVLFLSFCKEQVLCVAVPRSAHPHTHFCFSFHACNVGFFCAK